MEQLKVRLNISKDSSLLEYSKICNIIDLIIEILTHPLIKGSVKTALNLVYPVMKIKGELAIELFNKLNKVEKKELNEYTNFIVKKYKIEDKVKVSNALKSILLLRKLKVL